MNQIDMYVDVMWSSYNNNNNNNNNRSLVSRALVDWSDMCTMSGCESWDDLFAKYGVVGSQQY